MKHWRCGLLLFFIPISEITAQEFRSMQITPGFSVGYIFNAGIALSAELQYTPLLFDTGNQKTAAGLYTSYTYFFSKGELYSQTWYHTVSAGLTATTANRFMYKAGFCKTVLRWGRDNMNKTKSKKVTPDLDFSYAPFRNSAWVGYRLFFPGNACFGLDIGTAHMLCTACRYNFDAALNPVKE